MKKYKALPLVYLALFFFGAYVGGCKGKKSTPPVATPTPVLTSPTPAPVAPTPTPTPDSNCINSLPATPVRVYAPNGSCASGYVKMQWHDGSNICVAASACRNATRENFRCWIEDYPELLFGCHPMNGNIDYENVYQHWRLDKNTGLLDDADRGQYDAFGRQVWGNQVTRDWGWTGTCEPKMCKKPRPNRQCNSPTPPPIARFELTNMGREADGYFRLDVTPIVCDGPAGSPTANYCATVWNGERTGCCPTRRMGDPMREICDNEVTGQDPVTGKFGPHFGVEGPRDFRTIPESNYVGVIMANQAKVRVCSNPYLGETAVCTWADVRD